MPLHAQKNMELSASEVAQRMMPGWNLGNTLEAGQSWAGAATFNNKGGLGSETAWQGTKTTQAIIDYVKSQGFRSVRIPCAWVWGHMSDATNFTIDPTWMARVKQVVDYCIKDSLYVLLNDHWDGGWLDDNLTTTGAQKEKNKAVLTAIWTQIANEFKDYDDHLVFAGQNEPPINNQLDIPSLVEYQQTFIDAVRATGGNNAKRLLVVQGPSTDAEKTCNWLADKMPTDPSGKLAVEVHLYYPWNFWGMEKDESWGNAFYYWGNDNHVSGSKHNATYGEEADLKELIDKLKTKFVDKGFPVINGEYGIIWRTITGTNESQEKHNASIKYYYKLMNQLCMERGIVPMVWDTNYTSGTNTMTVIDRKNLTIFNPHVMDGIYEAMKALGISTTSISSIKNYRIDMDNRIYDLYGRQVAESKTASLPKGVYLQKGKKYIVNLKRMNNKLED